MNLPFDWTVTFNKVPKSPDAAWKAQLRQFRPKAGIRWASMLSLSGVVACIVFLLLGMLAGYSIEQTKLSKTTAVSLLKFSNRFDDVLTKSQADNERDLTDFSAKLDANSHALGDMLGPNGPSKTQNISTAMSTLRDTENDLREKLHSENVQFDKDINDHRKRALDLNEGLKAKVEASENLWASSYDQGKLFLKWIGALSFLAIVGIIVLLLALSNRSVRNFIAATGTISAFGLTFKFNDIQSVRASIALRGRQVEDDVKSIYLKVLRDYAVESQFFDLMASLVDTLRKNNVSYGNGVHIRATLYVPGFVGQDLVQAARYYGNWPEQRENVVGRPFSVRFGIIGKAWRLQVCQYYPNVDNSDQNLIRNWGFLRAEAEGFSKASTKSGSLMAFPIADVVEGPPLGIVYLEADQGDALHPAGQSLSADQKSTTNPQDGLSEADDFAVGIWSGVNDDCVRRLTTKLIRLQSLMRWNDKLLAADGR